MFFRLRTAAGILKRLWFMLQFLVRISTVGFRCPDVLVTFSMFDLKICQLFFHWRSYNSHILRNHTHTLLNIESSSSWNQNPNRDLTGFSPLLNNKCIQIVKLELSWVHFIENRYREKNICKFSISYFLKIWKQTYLKYRTLP